MTYEKQTILNALSTLVPLNIPVSFSGWVKSIRLQKKWTFIELNDGSTRTNLQIIVDSTIDDYDSLVNSITTGASLEIQGLLIESPAKGQSVELSAHSISLLGTSDSDYPLQKKRHSFEFLREKAHLRVRSNTAGAVARIRSRLSYAVHTFFQDNGYFHVHTPIITASDCEGAGEMFSISGGKDEKEDFFGTPAHLTVSGQLNAEAYALGLSKVYTFGPTFRAENSHSTRHLSEFWMIEPELCFVSLDEIMSLAESFIKYVIQDILKTCKNDMELFTAHIKKGIVEDLHQVSSQPFIRITYEEAIDILKNSGKEFEYPPTFGNDLQTEHERFLCETHFKCPTFVYNYPKTIKAFYMRDNDDNVTVGAMDLLVPGVGELIGGSEREERYDVLIRKMSDADISVQDLSWYVDLRKYGSCKHGGFGVGFERLIQFITGMENIRDVIPFPRYKNHCEF